MIESLVGGSGGKAPPEAETCLAFGRSMETTKFTCFLIFGNAKNNSYLQSA